MNCVSASSLSKEKPEIMSKTNRVCQVVGFFFTVEV